MEYKNAGFFRRFLAQAIDWLIMLALFFSLLALVLLGVEDVAESPVVWLNTLFYVISFIMLVGVLNTLYAVYFISRFGGTIGKLLMGIKILDVDTNENIDKKTALYRIFPGYAFSAQIFWLGFLRVFRNEERRAWHDELFNTKVVIARGSALGVIAFILLSVILAVVMIFALFSLVGALEFEDYTEVSPFELDSTTDYEFNEVEEIV